MRDGESRRAFFAAGREQNWGTENQDWLGQETVEAESRRATYIEEREEVSAKTRDRKIVSGEKPGIPFALG